MNELTKIIFRSLNVKPGEEFIAVCDDWHKRCYLDENLQLWVYSSSENTYTITGNQRLHSLLNGTAKIIRIQKKINPTEEEQVAITYVLACGFRWITKNEMNAVEAFEKKPYKVHDDIGYWISDDVDDGIQIHIPISFISWEDDEPFDAEAYFKDRSKEAYFKDRSKDEQKDTTS